MAIWRMHIARWIPKATNAYSDCVTHIAFPLQQWFHERTSLLRYMYIAHLFDSYPHALSANSGIVPEIIPFESVRLNCVLNLSCW